MSENEEIFRLRYYPIQSFGIWNKEGWNCNRPYYENCSDYCAVIINGDGHLELISPFEIPDDADIQFIPAQTDMYAVIQELGYDERYFLGCTSDRQMLPITIHRGNKQEITLSKKMITGEETIPICGKCGHIFSMYEPEFCVSCGSFEKLEADISWVKGHITEKFCLGSDGRF